MSEKVLLNSGYKLFEVEHPKNCDRFYQKKIADKKHFNVYYYDKFKDDGSLDYSFEYELYEEKQSYVITKYIYGLDNYPYTVEEIENILLNKLKEKSDYKSRIDKALSWTNRTIEIIKQQPTEDDTWILKNLHSIKYLLQGSDEE